MTGARHIGVRGGSLRATVDPHGTVITADGKRMEWHVAGDDRWYSSITEPTVRQKWYAGFPVVETRMKVGPGDVVQRAYCVAAESGITVVEFENETPVSVVVALTRGDLLTSRPLGNTGPQGIDLPAGSVVLPLGHKASFRIGIAGTSPAPGRLPEDLPDHQAILRGWESACEVASRVNVPDHAVVTGINAARSDLLLGDAVHAIEAVRLGETHRDSIIEVVDAVQARLKSEKRSRVLAWDTPHLLATASRACVLLDDERASGDIGASWLRIADREVEEPPAQAPAGLAVIAWAESLLAKGSPSGGVCEVLPHGIPETWWGASFDCHGLVADPFRSLSYAVRWHGARPALLWETKGSPGLVLTGGRADREWHSTDPSGETLLAAPVAN